MLADLHTHTTASDGELAPAELLQRASDRGVTHLAITDHDTVAAYENLPPVANLTIVPGVELSSRWRKIGVHVVGLNIDPGCAELTAGLERQQAARCRRAERIAARLVKAGLPDPLSATRELAGSAILGRPHFAQHLVAAGHVKNVREAFRRYLGTGKAGDVRDEWAPLDDVIGWIGAAGGIAVLAHPAHYRLTRTRLRALLDDFGEAGGSAMEVVSGQQAAAVTTRLAGLAVDAGLLASIGSDFHRPDAPWADVGRFPPLPAHCRPVWSAWE